MLPRVVALENEKVYLSSEELDTTAPSLVRQAELERGVLARPALSQFGDVFG